MEHSVNALWEAIQALPEGSPERSVSQAAFDACLVDGGAVSFESVYDALEGLREWARTFECETPLWVLWEGILDSLPE